MGSVSSRRSRAVIPGAQGFSALERELGSKAAGLHMLPSTWVPPFVVLGASFRKRWRPGMDVGAALAREAKLGRELAQLLESARVDSDEGIARLLVRSNGPGEHGDPGGGETFVAPAEREALESVLHRALRASADSYPLVQRAIEPGVLGLMSNDRRFSPRRDTWLVEGNLRLRGPELARVRAGTGIRRGALRACRCSELLGCLRTVATWMARGSGEWRLEWIWDGRRVWVLQADPLLSAPADTELARYLRSRDRSGPRAEDSVVPRKLRGAKVDAWRRFWALGWPSYPLEVVTGEQWRSGLRSGALEKRLGELAGQLVVVRSDVADGRAGLLLPTSAPSREPAAILAFMSATAERFRTDGLADHDWMFLLSPLILARASVLAQAAPSSGAVELDALWGFPDGLLYLPHDSCRIDADGAVRYTRAHKPHCLLAQEGGWQLAPVPAPFDWSPVLNAVEARQVAVWARAFAEQLDAPVILMVLARVGGRRGAQACIPFFASSGREGRPKHRGRGRRRAAQFARVSSPAELEVLAASSGAPAGIDLRPAREWNRDVNFLRSVAQYSAAAGVPVAFHGSLLGHAADVLGRWGASVIRAQDEPGTPGRDEDALWPLVVREGDGLARVEAFARATAGAALARQINAEASGADGDRKLASMIARNARAAAELTRGRLAPTVPGAGFQELGSVSVSAIGAGSLPDDEPGVASGFMRKVASG